MGLLKAEAEKIYGKALAAEGLAAGYKLRIKARLDVLRRAG
jgi:hypothetical protein